MDICVGTTFHDGSTLCLAIMHLRGSSKTTSGGYAKQEYPEALEQIVEAIRTRYDLTGASDVATVYDSGTS